jgi:alpha-D-ribose 1-methylphosphonate 5-triphosphate synthase subunit PhnG
VTYDKHPERGALTPERRAELLAAADATAVAALASRLITSDWSPTAVTGPETGMVVLEVREPVAEERFHLAEVLVTRAEVSAPTVASERRRPTSWGWSMRIGAEPEATWSAAVCDAAVEAGHPDAAAVHALCEDTAAALAAADAAERAELAATEVRFEELDR